ncbi:caspase family protein [Sphaerospermopsis aphanizomenoides BCCUSP55]|uniref:caspase family protein n=1 Tax=Sphaerospermopsis aphanizomenoides TaxID=459663 RepID=UPI001907AF4E|nr:caspase family protein [Sphaerospermopsis aphanizomenoides]MBK1987964.1 caspase family protein [Sphaerospermopsis aphanizomenoides BCCUSP55]
MVNYWAIAIGINQYELFQPLSCAQTDAEAIKEFLVTEVGFLPQNCLLMTNTSPPIAEKTSYPTKDNILSVLEELAATSWQPEDHLWFFFSGYGVNHNDKDYLMPVDGDPDLVVETGIAVRQVMQSLQVAELKTLLIFDINRAFGTQADAPVGQEILDMAKELQMPVMLSCQPEEFSHESSELGYGFFTAALLEALRSGKGSSLKDLESYVSSLTPELCQHHWRPIQNPVTVIPNSPPDILPILILDDDEETQQLIFPEENFAVPLTAPSLGDKDSRNSTTDKAWWAKNQTPETTLNQTSETSVAKLPVDSNQILATSPELQGRRFIPASAKDYATPATQEHTPIWKQFILWGGGSMVIVALIVTFLLRNQASFRFKKLSPPINNTTNSDFSNSLPAIPAAVETIKPVGAAITATSDTQKRSQALLELKKMSLKETEPSDLKLAIATAKKINSSEPLYQQTQENIQVWNQMILDLATGHAQQKQYSDAIATAELITKDELLYPQAQTAIEKWQLEAKLYLSNKTLLDAANALIQPGQASTYNRAIEVAKKVPPGQPGFEIAQTSINKWSEQILELAKNRAAQGEFSAAIATAALVPQITPAYQDAQDAIQKWQSKVKD